MSKAKIFISINGRQQSSGPPAIIGGRYEPRQQIGKGGMGEVSLAYDTQLERWVAVKRILVDIGAADHRAKLTLNEAKRLARLQHPNIVTVYDVLTQGNDLHMVMEYLSGYTLEDLEAPLPVSDFIDVARQCLAGLSAAHSVGMIHLDIKPTNIMLVWLSTGQLQVKLLDFGLATVAEQPEVQEVGENGSLFGSVHTLAPEQLELRPVDGRTDLYSLGCVLYYILCMREPFSGQSVEEIVSAHLSHSFRPLAEIRPDLPPALCEWVEWLMSREPGDRPESAGAALQKLPAHLAGRRRSERPAEGAVQELDPKDTSRIGEYLGHLGALTGKVARVWDNAAGTIRFINFEGIGHGEFSVVILLKGGHPDFSKERLEELIGEEVRVTGRISEFHGCPQILVDSPNQIVVRPDPAPV